ncbi:MAG: DUF1549 domain-containing protein [Pirellulales bacterium]|nr:DUF1549 domain-containing protein [Pirellulales bacterium]
MPSLIPPVNPPEDATTSAKPQRYQRLAVFFGVVLLMATALGSALVPQREPQSRLPKSGLPSEKTLNQIQLTASLIDQQMAAGWKNHAHITPAPPANDLLVMRRLSLALRGTIPSLEEIRNFESLPPKERLNWWLADIFADRRYADYTAERFARAWVGVEDGPFILFRRRLFVNWVSQQFQANRPLDEIVRELITAKGIWTEKPAVNFLTVTIDNDDESKTPKANLLTSRISRAFLGIRMDCAECHNHPFDERWTQAGYQGMSAFLGQARMGFSGIYDDPNFVYQVDDLKTGQQRGVEPGVPFGHDWLPADGTRRDQLATWVTHRDNPAFPRAIANRAWGLMFGKPLVDPVDDIPPENLPFEKSVTTTESENYSAQSPNNADDLLEDEESPASSLAGAEQVLDTLARDFARHDYDLQRLFRVIAATQVFQRESRSQTAADGSDQDAMIAGDANDNQQLHALQVEPQQVWAEFPLIRLRPEQIIGSLVQAGTLGTIDDQSHLLTRLIRFFRERDFVQRYGDAGSDELSESGGTIPQSLLLMNGNLVREVIAPEFLNGSARIARLSKDHRQAIEITFLTLLTRRPTPAEADYFASVWAEREAALGRAQLVYDLYWTLLNSTEFRWNH